MHHVAIVMAKKVTFDLVLFIANPVQQSISGDMSVDTQGWKQEVMSLYHWSTGRQTGRIVTHCGVKRWKDFARGRASERCIGFFTSGGDEDVFPECACSADCLNLHISDPVGL